MTTTLTGGRSPAARTPQPSGSSARSRGRRSRRSVGVLLVLVLLLLCGAVVSAMVLDQRLRADPVPGPGAGTPGAGVTSSSAPPPTAAGAPVVIAAAQSFDPQGDEPKVENPDEVPLAYDKNLKTRWRTVQYLRNPKLGGIKRGVGLVLDLGTAQPVREVALILSGTGTDVELRVPVQDPAAATPPMGSDGDWRRVAKKTKAGGRATLTAEAPVTTRYVLVYLTSLPKEGGGYRGGIVEAEVRT